MTKNIFLYLVKFHPRDSPLKSPCLSCSNWPYVTPSIQSFATIGFEQLGWWPHFNLIHSEKECYKTSNAHSWSKGFLCWLGLLWGQRKWLSMPWKSKGSDCQCLGRANEVTVSAIEEQRKWLSMPLKSKGNFPILSQIWPKTPHLTSHKPMMMIKWNDHHIMIHFLSFDNWLTSLNQERERLDLISSWTPEKLHLLNSKANSKRLSLS